MNEADNNQLASADQLADLFEGTTGRPTSLMDTITVYRAGKEDYFRRGDEKVPWVHGILLFSQRPMRTWWASDEISDKPPECFSLDGFKPSPESSDVQSDDCATCAWDKFGTASKGRGKACKTRAADFVLEVNVLALGTIPSVTPTSLPVVTLEKKHILGPAIIRYGIGNREASDAYAAIMRFAKERGSYVQGLLCRWAFAKGQSKGNIEYDVVVIEALAKIDDAAIQAAVVPLVRTLKGGQALELLTALAGKKEDGEPVK